MLAAAQQRQAHSYRLDIDRMTGTDRFTMELSAGDTLAVQFETTKGSIYMEIKENRMKALYTPVTARA